MSGYWKLNGIELTEATVTIAPVTLTSGRRTRQAIEDVSGDGQYRERLGSDLARVSIDLGFWGEGDQKFVEIQAVVDTIDDEEVWTLEAPSLKPVYVIGSSKRAALATESWDIDPQKGMGKAHLKIQAIVDGIWIVDGGDYAQLRANAFTLVSTGPSSFRRDEDAVVTGTTPLLRLREQSSGYPKAVRASDFAVIDLTPAATTTISGVVYEDYDLTGYLHPAPAVAGDVGLYEVLDSPLVPGALP